MTKGLPRSRNRGRQALKGIIKQTITLKNLPMTINGATGVGFGTVQIGDFPEGNILFHGAVSYVSLTGPGAGAVATFNGDYAIGTAPNANTTLTGTDVDIIPSTSTPAAVTSVSPSARATNATVVIFDNTDGSLEFNLNVLIDDADISADALTFYVNGSLDIAYTVLGDD